MNRTAARAAVRSRGWLASTPDAFQDALLERSELLFFPKGATLYHAGDEPAGLYGLAHGLLAVLLPPREPEGSLIHLRGPGFWVGEGGALAGSSRQITMAAKNDSWCWRLGRPALQAMVAEDPSRWQWFGTLGIGNLTEALAIIDALTTMAPARRVAKMLLRLLETDGDGRTMVSASQWEIAEISALRRKMVHATLRDFANRGWLARHYGQVELLDLEKIQMLAEHG